MKKIARKCMQVAVGLSAISCGISEIGGPGKQDINDVWTAPSSGIPSTSHSRTYVTAFDYPEGYDWRHNPEKGSVRCSLIVFSDSKPVMKVPVGDAYLVSDDPDMHRVIDGHLYTDFATDSETVIKKDGKPFISYEGRETIVTALVKKDSLHTLGQKRNGKGFSYRVNGRVVLERESGYVFGRLTELQDDVCFAFAEPVGSSESKSERYYCFMNGSVSQVALREDVKKVWDVCFHQEKVYCLAALTGISEPVVIAESRLDALSMPYGSTIVSGQFFSAGNILGIEMILESGSDFFSAMWLQNTLFQKFAAGLTVSSIWSGPEGFACVLNSGSPSVGGTIFRMGERYDLPLGFCCLGGAPVDVADGILTVGLSSVTGKKPMLWKDGKTEELDVNGYICTVSSVPGK